MRFRVAILASTLGLASSRAESAAPTALSWNRLAGAEACPGLKEVAARVNAHLGRDPFAPPSVASVFIEATIAPAAGGWTTQIDFSSSSGSNPSGQRTLESAEQECGAAVEAAALAIALMIDPEALTREASPAPAPPTPALPTPALKWEEEPEPRLQPSSAPCPPPAPGREAWRTRVALGALTGMGQLPSASGGPWLGIRLSPAERRAGLDLAFSYLAPRAARVTPEAGGEFSSLTLLGSAFWSPLRERSIALSVVGGVELGRIFANGFGFRSFRSDLGWTLAPTADLELSLEVAPTWELWLRLGLGVALLRDQFEFSELGSTQAIFQPEPLFGRAALGVAFAP